MQIVFAFLVFLFSCSKDAEQTVPPEITPPPTGIPDITITLKGIKFKWIFQYIYFKFGYNLI
mgnify:CR=1 FL=1